jgi:hypothetical protein
VSQYAHVCGEGADHVAGQSSPSCLLMQRMCHGAAARHVLALLIFSAVIAWQCGANRPPAPRGPALIVVYPDGLTLVALDGTPEGVLVRATPNAAPSAPAVSPDGAQIAYIEKPRPGSSDSGADLWIARSDGADPHRLLAHPQPDHSIRTPAWEDNRHVLVVIDQSATCAGCNPTSTTTQVLERVDVATGRLMLLRDGVTSFDVSPDGGSVVFPDTTSGVGAALLSSPVDASPARAVVPLTRAFAEITAARYAPDGETIAFAAAENRSVRASQPLVSRLAFEAAAAPVADGLPEDIWLIDASGAHVRILTTLRESLPDIAWSPDGTALYVIGAVALYRIDVMSGDVENIGRGATGSQIAMLNPHAAVTRGK